MPGKPHIVVIGAGAFGGWTALYLLRSGARVTLVDAWGPGNSRSSSGGETRVIRGAMAQISRTRNSPLALSNCGKKMSASGNRTFSSPSASCGWSKARVNSNAARCRC